METQKSLSTAQIAHRAADIALDKRGEDLVVLDVSGCSPLTDYLIVVTAHNARQVKAMTEEIDKEMKRLGTTRLSTTGKEHGWWVLVDLGDVVVHIMQRDARLYYDLEALWADGRVVRRVVGAEANPSLPKTGTDGDD